MEKQFIILIKCKDALGLIANVSSVLSECTLNIIRNDEFVDNTNKMFFNRAVIQGTCHPEDLRLSLIAVLPEGAEVSIEEKQKRNVVLFATKEYHCLGEILLRGKFDDINANILAVISNHDSLRSLVESFGIPYYFIPSKGLERLEHEELIQKQLSQFDPDYLILAKYMRILSPGFVATYKNNIINIHHSFLPAFIGANPYRQAFERGVKIIGATAHYVTDDLDEGPIIEQNVKRIDHTYSPADLAKIGRDTEKMVLMNALDKVLSNKVMINGNKTIVF